MPSYFALKPRQGFIRNITNVNESPPGINEGKRGGLTMGDIARAETMAFNEINSRLARFYSDTIATWAESPPPIIAQIAELLAAAHVWSFSYANDGQVGGEPVGSLQQQAMELLDSIENGVRDVVGTDMTIVARRTDLPE